MKTRSKIFILSLILIISGCVTSQEVSEDSESHYDKNISLYFSLCEEALFNKSYQSTKLINQGFKKNNLRINGGPNYILSRGLTSQFVSITFPYERNPNECKIIFADFIPSADVLEPLKKAIQDNGYTPHNDVLKQRDGIFQKGDRQIQSINKLLSDGNNSNRRRLFLRINKI